MNEDSSYRLVRAVVCMLPLILCKPSLGTDVAELVESYRRSGEAAYLSPPIRIGVDLYWLVFYAPPVNYNPIDDDVFDPTTTYPPLTPPYSSLVWQGMIAVKVAPDGSTELITNAAALRRPIRSFTAWAMARSTTAQGGCRMFQSFAETHPEFLASIEASANHPIWLVEGILAGVDLDINPDQWQRRLVAGIMGSLEGHTETFAPAMADLLTGGAAIVTDAAEVPSPYYRDPQIDTDPLDVGIRLYNALILHHIYRNDAESLSELNALVQNSPTFSAPFKLAFLGATQELTVLHSALAANLGSAALDFVFDHIIDRLLEEVGDSIVNLFAYELVQSGLISSSVVIGGTTMGLTTAIAWNFAVGRLLGNLLANPACQYDHTRNCYAMTIILPELQNLDTQIAHTVAQSSLLEERTTEPFLLVREMNVYGMATVFKELFNTYQCGFTTQVFGFLVGWADDIDFIHSQARAYEQTATHLVNSVCESYFARIQQRVAEGPNPPSTLPPTGIIVSITPNPAQAASGVNVTFMGAGHDNDEVGSAPEIATFHWSSNLGTTGGMSDLYFGPISAFNIPASNLVTGSHTITLRVLDNDGEWSAPVSTSLNVVPGPVGGDLAIHAPTQGSPVTVSPTGSFCADVSWNLTDVPGFNPSVGVEVQFAVETAMGGWYVSLAKEPFVNATQSHFIRCGLALPSTCNGARDFRVQIRDAETSQVLVEVVEPDAIQCAPGTPTPDFSLAAFPTSVPGSSPGAAQVSVIAQYANGFAAPIQLSVPSGLPQGVTATFSPNPLVPPTTLSILNLNIPAGIAGNNYQFTVFGNGGGLLRAANPAPTLQLPGQGLTITYLSMIQDPSNHDILSIHYRLGGIPGSYYPIRWQYMRPGENFFRDIDPECIDPKGAVPCPDDPCDPWIYWDMACGPNSLSGYEGTAFFKMQVSSTSDGGLLASQVGGTLPYRVVGQTWDGTSFYLSTAEENGEHVRRFNSTWSQLPGGDTCIPPIAGNLWALMYYDGKPWATAYSQPDRIYPLDQLGCAVSTGCNLGTASPPYQGPAAAGTMWTDIGDAYGVRPFFLEGSTIFMRNFDCYASPPPPEFDAFLRWNIIPLPGLGGIQFGSGITFDGNYVWVSDSDNPRIVGLHSDDRVGETWPVAEDRYFDTTFFTGEGRGPSDLVYANGFLYAPVRIGDGSMTNVFEVATPTLSQRTQSGFQFDLNSPPACSSLVVAPGCQTGDIALTRQLSDPESDKLCFSVEYSIDDGASWATCSVSGQTCNIESAGYGGMVTWNSKANLPDYQGPVQIRLTPRDSGSGTWCETSLNLENCANEAPNQPENIYPILGQTNASLTLVLLSSSFADSDCNSCNPPNSHFATELQIRRDDGDYSLPAWQTVASNPGVTSIAVPVEAALQCNTSYWWRCRYQDDSGSLNSWSAWSAETRFRTGHVGVDLLDLNCDHNLDLHDHGSFITCETGPRVGYIVPNECLDEDLDHDGDVDLFDWSVYQLGFEIP